jgi:carbamoyl-phosphate synthase large subunit
MSGGPRILLLSGTSLVGQSVLACLADRRSGIRVAATSSAPEEAAAFDFDLAYAVPETRRCPEQHAARFAEVLAHFGPDLVIPCRDDDVIFLAAQRARAPAMARRFLCGDAAVAAAIFDKLDSAGFCARHGLPFVPTLGAGDGLQAARRFAAAHGFPMIAKPRCGFASRGVRLILDERQLAQACAQPDLVLQKYLGDPGAVRQLAADIDRLGVPLFHTLEQEKLSVQASIGPDGEVTDVFAFVNAMRFGRSEAVRCADDARLVAAGRSWAVAFADAGWRGPLNVQGHRNADGTMTIFEFNGRFTGSTAARLLLGYDEVGVALRDWLGFAPAPARAVANEVRFYPTARAVRDACAARLRRQGRGSAAA